MAGRGPQHGSPKVVGRSRIVLLSAAGHGADGDHAAQSGTSKPTV